MGNLVNISIYMVTGLVGGFLGDKSRIPAGAIMGAMIAVIIMKLILKSEWALPKNVIFLLQVFVGVMVGTTFKPSLLPIFYKMVIPVIVSCVVLVVTGLVLAFIFSKLGFLDMSTGYLSTSPGAMIALLTMALENNINVNATVVACFHVFRLIFVILTAPIIFKFLSN